MSGRSIQDLPLEKERIENLSKERLDPACWKKGKTDGKDMPKHILVTFLNLRVKRKTFQVSSQIKLFTKENELN